MPYMVPMSNNGNSRTTGIFGAWNRGLTFLDTDERRTQWLRNYPTSKQTQTQLITWNTSESIWIYFWDFWDMLDHIIA